MNGHIRCRDGGGGVRICGQEIILGHEEGGDLGKLRCRDQRHTNQLDPWAAEENKELMIADADAGVAKRK